ncbi:hypothetical protein DV737_g2223, partial [Chaetothyriales sp. CBS 132003]
MRTSIFVILTLFTSALSATVLPDSDNVHDLSIRETDSIEIFNALEKRKGGGGGKGGGSGSSGSGSSGSSGSSSSGSSGGRSSPYSFQSSSNAGGRTKDGSGTQPSYGNKYAGGAVVPFTAGQKSPTKGIVPYALPLAGFALFPALWLYGSLWAYPYPLAYHWMDGGRNRTSNVTCVCQRYQVCGCDPQDNSTFLNEVVANGTGGAPINSSVVRTGVVNGTTQTFINGSLANGTTASGGTDPSNESEVSAAVRLIMELSGYWVMAATVLVGVYLT